MALSDVNVQVFSIPHGGPGSECCAWCDPDLRNTSRGEAWRREVHETMEEEQDDSR